MDYVILKPAELMLWKEKAAPIIRKVTDLLLRGGGIGYLNMEQLLNKGSDEDMAISKDKRRVNPVAFKSIMQQCGVLLTPEEHRTLRTAYSDEGGFLVDDFLYLVSPLRSLDESQISLLQSISPGVVGDGVGDASLIDLKELRRAFEDVLRCENVSKPKTDRVEELENAVAAVSPLFTSTLLEMRMVFTPSRYPKALVPARDVGNFCAAIVLNSGGDGMSVLQQVAKVQLQPAASTAAAGRTQETTNTYSADCMGSSQQDKRPERGYDYYTDRDNRDEWIRGREESEARPMYLRHLPGYSGHLPTFKSKCGRSFHVIEESMPDLTQPKKQPGPLPADSYGPGVELKGNPMNRHNFKFS